MFNPMLNFLRGILPRSVKQLGKMLLGLPSTRIHPDWRILEALGPIDDAHVVFDLGARNGWFLSSWKKFSPLAQIHAFEPDPDAFNRLVERFSHDSTIRLSDRGIGAAESTKTFYRLSQSEVSSSFLQPDQEAWTKIHYQTGDIKQQELPITTLDAYCLENQVDDIYLMKIDVQGYEMQALKGATETLQKTSFVLVESAIRELYHESANFTQVHEYLVKQGFHLMDLRAWHRGNNVLIETDMLFRRNDLMPKLDSQQPFDREYI